MNPKLYCDLCGAEITKGHKPVTIHAPALVINLDTHEPCGNRLVEGIEAVIHAIQKQHGTRQRMGKRP